jgi:hypothetical protein
MKIKILTTAIICLLVAILIHLAAAIDIRDTFTAGHKAPRIETVDDLAGKEIFVRASSSYYSSLLRLNERFRKTGQKQK